MSWLTGHKRIWRTALLVLLMGLTSRLYWTLWGQLALSQLNGSAAGVGDPAQKNTVCQQASQDRLFLTEARKIAHNREE